ncbi:peptidoglycan DD-metalloendopeptidase family protein [Candidatus Woesearchaeota archaeon]|nr:peptidoglycan DD-metalloendopeptidase family protein [Candidatus Woesearchaeota archaeon]
MKNNYGFGIVIVFSFIILFTLMLESAAADICPAGYSPAPPGVIGPVRAMSGPVGVASSSPSEDTEPGTILEITRRYEGRAYGTGSGEFTDLSFVEQVIRDLGIEVTDDMHRTIFMLGVSPGDSLNPTEEPGVRGVEYALTQAGKGDTVALAEALAGDIVLYWQREGTSWNRRAGFITVVKPQGVFDIYGPYPPSNAVGVSTDVNLNAEGTTAFIVRIRSGIQLQQSAVSSSSSTASSSTTSSSLTSPSSSAGTPSASSTSVVQGCGSKVAVVGDSLTAGSRTYVRDLRSICSDTEFKNEDDDPATRWERRAIRGNAPMDKFATVGKGTSAMRRDFDAVLAWNPDTIIILGGTNDLTGDWTRVRDNLLDMYNRAKSAGKRVVAVTIPPFKTTGTRTEAELETLLSVNRWIMEESPADLKVNIYPHLVAEGTDDINTAFFAGDKTHPVAAGYRIIAERLHDVFSGAPPTAISSSSGSGASQSTSSSGSGASQSTSSSGSASSPSSSQMTCVPDNILPSTLFDFIINSSGGVTSIVGISRQNIAVGINKNLVAISQGAVCQPIQADLNYDIDFLRETYGQTQMDVDSQLETISFLDNEIRVHRRIAPVLGCVENALQECGDYSFRSVSSYEVSSVYGLPDLLSTSSFGISLNINLGSNPNDQSGELITDMPTCVVDAFRRFGFRWGGDFETAKCPSYFGFMAHPNRIVIQQGITCQQGSELVTIPSNSLEAMGTSGGVTPGASSLIGNSDFMWPIPEDQNGWNDVISCYGPRNLGYGAGYHDGLDLNVVAGTPIIAISNGEVRYMCKVPNVCRRCNVPQSREQARCAQYAELCGTKPCRGFGNNIVIKHADNLYTHYVHMDSINSDITRGASVAKGQLLGTVGNTGFSQGRHLHFAIYNTWPKSNNLPTPDYPEAGRSPFCFFSDSILTRLNVHRTNCPQVFGEEGQIISSTNAVVVRDCQQADLSALQGLMPTPLVSVPASSIPGQPTMVQACRPEPSSSTTTSAAEGMISADSVRCTYCEGGKQLLRSISPQDFARCSSVGNQCCDGPCPSSAIMKSGVEFIGQCTPAMGEGGDCWHDGVPPERPEGSTDANNYCKSACGVAVTRMALKSFNIEKSSRDLFCGGPDSVYRPGGSNYNKIVEVATNLGLSGSSAQSSIDWNGIVSSIKQGKVVALLLNDHQGSGPLERCFETSGHFILLHGASDEYVISHDPGRSNPSCAVNLVLSKNYIERVGRSYAVIG